MAGKKFEDMSLKEKLENVASVLQADTNYGDPDDLRSSMQWAALDLQKIAEGLV